MPGPSAWPALPREQPLVLFVAGEVCVYCCSATCLLQVFCVNECPVVPYMSPELVVAPARLYCAEMFADIRAFTELAVGDNTINT